MFGTLRRYVNRKRAARMAAERAEKLAALQSAIKRRDTRAQHDRWPAAFKATTAALRGELGR